MSQPQQETFWFDQKRNLLIYPAAFSSNIQQAIPEARLLNGHYLAVPRTLRNSQVLRWFNYPVLPIITDETYDFPIKPGRKPLDPQRLMANFSVLHPRMFNLSEPGTMKSLSSLWAYDFLRRKFPKGVCRVLIVGTLSTLETGWANEIYSNFLDNMTFEILHGTPEKRLAGLVKDRDAYIVNHDGIKVGARFNGRRHIELDGFCKELANRKDIKVIIFDEASALGDATTARSRLARMMFTDRPYLWPLTGSPTPQYPTDCYGIAKFVNNAMSRSFGSFQLETMVKVTQFKWVPRKDGYERAVKLLTPAIHIPISEVWQGPELLPVPRIVALTEQQKKLMADLKRDFVIRVKSNEPISAINEGAMRQKFLQISLGGVYDSDHVTHQVDAKPRFAEVDAVIEETPRKVVIFCSFTNAIENLYKHLNKRKAGATDIINGNVSQKERGKIIRAFADEASDLRSVICDPQATAHGINEFVAADTALWFSTTDKAELYDQGNKRIRRPGQKYPTRAVQLISNPLEKEIFRRLENNLALQGSLLSIVKEGIL